MTDNIRKNMVRYNLVPKALYFTSALTVNALHNYKAQFLVEKQKIPADRIGLVYAIVGINFIGSLFWTRLADYYSLHRPISIVAPIMYGLVTCLFLVEPPRNLPKSVYATGVMGLQHLFSSAIFPLLDAIVFTLLKRHAEEADENRALFGRQRLFGTLAFPVATGLGYVLVKGTNGFNALFINLLIAVSMYSSIVFFGVPSDLNVGAKEKDVDGVGKVKKPSFTEVLKFTFPALPVLLLFVLSSGYLRAIMNIYQNYMVDDLLHSHRSGPFILSLVRTASEASIFFYSKPAMEYLGISGALIVSQIAGIIRVLGYGLMPKQEQSVLYIAAPLELLKGINTGLVVSAATRLGNQMAPPGSHGTVHGLLAGTYTGLAMATGGLLSCYLMSMIEPDTLDSDSVIYAKLQSMFLISACGSTVVLILFVAFFGIFMRY